MLRSLTLSAFTLALCLPVTSFAADAGGGTGAVVPGGGGAAFGAAAAGSGGSGVTFGLGFSLAFGAGKPQPAFGIRVFSGDRKNSAVASVGLDYQFRTRKLRPSVGVAYLGSNTYIGADIGYSADTGLDFGLGLGGVNTQTTVPAPAAAPVVVPPPPPPPPTGT